MSLNHSPGIVTDGLVLYYDMANTKKSWRGKPTTNLYGDFGASTSMRPNSRYDWNGTSWLNGNPGTNGPDIDVGGVWKFVSGALNSTWSGNSYGYMFKDIATANGVQYTGSFYCYVSADCNIDALPANSETTGGYATANLQSSYDMSKKGTWQRIGISTTGAGSTSRLLAYPQKYGVTDGSFTGYFLISASMFESGAFASKYTPNTRSNTQALVDLVGGNTLTANSLTYAADNTFSFNGSSHIYTPNNTSFDTQTPSVEVWVNTTATNQNGFWFEKGEVNTQYALFQEGPQIQWRMGPLGDSISFPTANVMVANNWYHVVATRTSGAQFLYINGVVVASGNQVGTLSTNTYGQNIGRHSSGYYFNGKLSVVKVYNRTLSPAEVKQNFDATRSRYSI